MSETKPSVTTVDEVFQKDSQPGLGKSTRESLQMAEEFFQKVGTSFSTDQFEEALEVIKIIHANGSDQDRNKHSRTLSLIVWVKIIDTPDLEERAALQKIYTDYPWIQPIITRNDPTMSSAPA